MGRKSNTSGLVLVAALVVIAIVWVRGRSTPVPPRSSAPMVSSAPEAAQLAASSPQPAGGSRTKDESPATVLAGRSVDATTGRPLSALIRSAHSPSHRADQEGWFQFEVQLGAECVLSFPGYRDLTVIYSSSSSTPILAKLVPEQQVRVIFLAGSDPVRGVRAWQGQDLLLDPLETPGISRLSDSFGTVTFPAARGCSITYRAPGGQSGWLTLLPGEDSVVQLGGATRRFRLLDSDGAPLAGIALEFSAGAIGMARRVQANTDDSGLISLPALRGPQLLSVGRPGFEIFSVLEGETRLGVRQPRPGIWAVTPRSEDESLTLRCSVQPVRFSVKDAETLVPVSAPCQWGVERPGSIPGTWSGFGRARNSAAVQGSFVIPRGALTTTIQEAEGSERLTLWFEGFAPWSTGITADLLQGGEVLLRNSPLRTLRPVGPSGGPYRGKFRVLDTRHGVYLGLDDFVQAGPEGLTEALPWSGSSWRILGLDGKSVADVPASALERGTIVEAHLPQGTGRIRFVGVPSDAPPPVAAYLRMSKQSWSGKLNTATPGGAPDEWLADGLVPGEYIVGPEELLQWYPSPSKYSKKAYPTVVVLPGETVDVPWQPGWHADTEYMGSLEVLNGSTSALKLFGLYGDGGHRRRLGSLWHRIPLDRDGRYVIRRGQALPRALLVGIAYPRDSLGWTGVMPLAVIGVGDDLRLDATPLRLHSSSGSLAELGITVIVPLEGVCTGPLQRYIVETEAKVVWSPGGPLEIPFLGGKVSRVRLLSDFGASEEISLDGTRKTSAGFEIRETELPAMGGGGGGLSGGDE
jgi:hypothetical protein